MAEPDSGVKPVEPTTPNQPPENKAPDGSEPVKTPVENPAKIAEELLDRDKRIVDKDRFNDLIDKSKLYETFAPIIEKVKDKPELVEKLLEIDKKGSLEERVARMEEDRKVKERHELRMAVEEALTRWPGFEKDWLEIRDQVEMLARRGLNASEALRRSYLALHPELASAEAERVARENAKALGQFKTGGSYVPNVVLNKKEETFLNEREERVAQDLFGKDYGGGFVPIKSKEDYARLLKKHEAHLKATGFYDLP